MPNIDGKPQWVMVGVGTARGVRVYASRELTRAGIPVMEHSRLDDGPAMTVDATGRNFLIIDGPDYPTVLARIQAIWQANPLPDLDAGPGWTKPRMRVSPGLADRMLPRLPEPGQRVTVELDTGYTRSGQAYPALPRSPGTMGAPRPPAERIPLDAPSPGPSRQPLAIEAPRKDDGG